MDILELFNSLAKFIHDGGFFMWLILIVWAIGIAICFERFNKLAFKYDVDGASFMNELQRYILSNDIQGAIRACSGSLALLPKVLKSGLKRSTSSSEQIQNALDATTLEVIPKVELRISHLNLIANISTLIGLLGTVHGIILTFTAISAADPAQKAEVLSRGISEAMNCTFLGLISAISMLIAHALLSSKADKIINEIDEYSVKFLDLMGTKNYKKEEEEA
ncbi:MAG: MotA/TolQ/ExbB proton channel family protein [Oligoflexia bacterium]|nr:MotA/TolQ/ExbB proton channel family protein [Oligoflexia bacterium]